MGRADTATKNFMRQNDVFADAFNFYLYGGRQVLHPEQLNELDSTELSYPFGADGRGEPVQKYRDVLEFIKYSGDKKKLVEWLYEEKPELTLGRREVEVLNACVNAKLVIKPEEEEVKVCKAIEDYKMEAVEKATKEVTESTRLSDLRNLMKNMQLTAQQAAAALGLSPEDTARLLEKL